MLKIFWVYQFWGAVQKDGRKYIEPRIVEVNEETIVQYGNSKISWIPNVGRMVLHDTEQECKDSAKTQISQHLKYLEEKKMLILKYETKLFERLAKI